MNAERILYALIALAIIGNALGVLSKKYPNVRLLKVVAGIITSLGAADMAKFAAVATSNEMKTLLFVKAVISKSAEELTPQEDSQKTEPTSSETITVPLTPLVQDTKVAQVEQAVEKSV